MRITTWNINGLRAAVGKGLFDSLEIIQTDIICLQEIKSRKEQLGDSALSRIDEIYPYSVWNPAQRPGYSGTSTWARVEPISFEIGLGVEAFDNEGRVIVTQFQDLILFNIYFPNGQRDLGRVPYKLDFYAYVLKVCDQLHAQGKQVIICGDFNTAHNEIDIRHPRENSHSTGFLPEERAWIDQFLAHHFIDPFRRLYPDRVEYTWWTYLANARKNNVGWRLDYFLISETLLPAVEDVINHTQIMGSDHCPVTLILN